MWTQIFEYAKQLLFLTQESQRNRDDIKEVRQELKDVRSEAQVLRQEFNQLTVVVQRLMYEVQRTNDNERHEREKLALQLRNEMLLAERKLKPSENEI